MNSLREFFRLPLHLAVNWELLLRVEGGHTKTLVFFVGVWF